MAPGTGRTLAEKSLIKPEVQAGLWYSRCHREALSRTPFDWIDLLECAELNEDCTGCQVTELKTTAEPERI